MTIILSVFGIFYFLSDALWGRYKTEENSHQQVLIEQKQVTKEDELQEDTEFIRVLLTDKNQFHTTVEVTAEEEINIEGTQVMLEPNKVHAIPPYLSENGDVIRLVSRGKISIPSIQKAQGVPSYEGILEIRKVEEGYLIINELPLERYLRYVVPSEMPSSYPMEALKAQAVCARTYAKKQMQEARLREFFADVDDTVNFQVYNNITSTDTTNEAVEETCGSIMTYDGEPIEAFFFSTSSGYTSTDEVWEAMAPAAYLKSVDLEEIGRNYEESETWYRWTLELPIEIIEDKMKKNGYSIGKLKEIEVLKRSTGGAVVQLSLVGEEGSVAISNEYKIRQFFSPDHIPIRCNDGSESTSMELLPSAYCTFTMCRENGRVSTVLIEGGGYGHGVGMSQNSAKHMALQGMTWEEILEVFYQGIVIE